jgi:hypothetical protein
MRHSPLRTSANRANRATRATRAAAPEAAAAFGALIENFVTA